jgi:hypothetical protein
MPKLNQYQVFKPENDFLAFPDHYVNLVGFIEFANLSVLAEADASGKQVIKRGTVVNMDADGKVTKAASGNGNGIIFDSIEVAKYDAGDVQVNATVLVHGFVRKDRLTNAENLAENGLIHVVNK